jgi:hypothetical protein
VDTQDTNPQVIGNWLTVAEAARLLQTTERQVRRRCAEGSLVARKDAKTWLIHGSSNLEPVSKTLRRVADGRTSMSVRTAKERPSGSEGSEAEVSMAELERFAQSAELQRLRVVNAELEGQVARARVLLASKDRELERLADTISGLVGDRSNQSQNLI